MEYITEHTLILQTKIYQFALDISPILEKFPSSKKFSLEQYIRNTSYDMLAEIIKYKNSRTISHLYNIDTDIDILRYYFRLAHETNVTVINNPKIENISISLNEIGRLNGGLIKYAKSSKKSREKIMKTGAEIEEVKKEVAHPIFFDPVTFDK